jgi:hypothetical protein
MINFLVLLNIFVAGFGLSTSFLEGKKISGAVCLIFGFINILIAFRMIGV